MPSRHIPYSRARRKLQIDVEDGLPKLSGTVFTLDMYRQLIELLKRLGDEDTQVIFDIEPEMKPPAARELVGKVPAVSPGAGAAKRNFSVWHLPQR